MASIPLYSTLLMLGALQGLLLGGVLWFAPSKRQLSNRFLATLLFFLTYRLIAETLWFAGLLHQNTWLYHVILEYNWVYGPLLYFYAISYLDPGFKLSRSSFIHFVPVLIEFLFSNFIKTQNLYWDGTRESLSWAGYWGYVLWMHTPFQYVVSASILLLYIYLSHKAIRAYALAATGNKSQMYLHWLKILIRVVFVFAAILIVLTMGDYLFFDYAFQPTYVEPIFVMMALITYWLGLQGFSRRHLPYPPHTYQFPIDQPAEAIPLKKRLEDAMLQDKLYLDPELTLQKLAASVGEKPHILTSFLNGKMGISFNDFVNKHRVQESIRRIQDPANDHLNITAIGLDAGFNSKSSFNRIFKQITGRTPGTFRNLEKR